MCDNDSDLDDELLFASASRGEGLFDLGHLCFHVGMAAANTSTTILISMFPISPAVPIKDLH